MWRMQFSPLLRSSMSASVVQSPTNSSTMHSLSFISVSPSLHCNKNSTASILDQLQAGVMVHCCIPSAHCRQPPPPTGRTVPFDVVCNRRRNGLVLRDIQQEVSPSVRLRFNVSLSVEQHTDDAAVITGSFNWGGTMQGCVSLDGWHGRRLHDKEALPRCPHCPGPKGNRRQIM